MDELRETCMNLQRQDQENYDPSLYVMTRAPAYVLEANPNIIHDIRNETMNPPP